MNPFDQAWTVLKDFYIGQGNELGTARMNVGGKQISHDYNPHLQGAGNLQERMVGTNAYEQAWGRPAPEWYPQNAPPQYSTETQTKPMHERQAGDTRYTAGMNLSNVARQTKENLGSDDPRFSNMGFNQFVSGKDGVAELMAHEHGHGLISDDIEAEKKWANNPNWNSKAHEIGAHTLQHPGGVEADIDARMSAYTHPKMHTQTFSDMPDLQNKIPYPAYAGGEGPSSQQFQNIIQGSEIEPNMLYPNSTVGVVG